MRTTCPVCGYPNLIDAGCDQEPVDCLFCIRCGWQGDQDISDDRDGESDSDDYER